MRVKSIVKLLILTAISTIHTQKKLENKIPTLLMTTEAKENEKSHHHILKGKVRLNGFQWETECDCKTKPERKRKTEQKCNPSLFRIFKDKSGNGLEYKDIRGTIGKIRNFKWSKVSKSSFSCVDGRVTWDALSTPGGDAGEFILALHSYQNYFGTRMRLNDEAVDRIFRRYLESMKQEKFRMCTDDISLEHIEKELTIEGVDLENPRETIQENLLKALLKPINTGDLHLRLMLKNPSMYSIDPDLIKMFLKSFYNNMWNNPDMKKKIKLDILVGKHDEKAFLEIKSNAVCTKDDIAPLMKQRKKKVSVFMNHIDAVQIRRAQLAYFFANVINMHQDPIDTVNSILFYFFRKNSSTGLINKECPFWK